MPNALCEAMLCECVPVGSTVNGIPEIIGETGVLVHKQDLEVMERALRKAVDMATGPAARSRILQNLPPEKRREMLIRVFRTVMGQGGA
jgi:glycosyltransferase involved in cell wall biosynthesis